MNVLVFYGADDAVFYHRGKKPYGELIREGHDVVFVNHEKVAAVLLDKTEIAVFIGRFDSAGAALMVLCKAKGIPTILDLDDNLLNVPERNPTYILWGDDPDIIQQHHENLILHPHVTPALSYLAQKRPQEVITTAFNRRIILICMIEMADAVTVTVDALAKVYQVHNDHVTVLPNYIDGDEWIRVTRQYKSDSGLTVGWAGGNTHYDALAEIEPVLRRFLGKNDRLITIGVPELHYSLFKDLPIESHAWMEWPAYQRAITSFDIALAPAVSNEFSRGKSAIRAMHANAVGIPVVGSPSTYKDYLKASGGGIIASTEKEWLRALNYLRRSDHRKELGHQGRKYVLSKCTYRANWHRWAKLCASLVLQSGS